MVATTALALGAALTVGGAAAGGIAGSNASKRAAAILRGQQARNRAWYEYNMNQDYTKRADALASIQRAREIFMERNKNASATAAVSGATDEAAARQKEDANKVIAETMSNIAAQGEMRKDEVEQRYLDREAQLAEQQRQTEIQKGQAIAGAASQVSKAGSNLMSMGAQGMMGTKAPANGGTSEKAPDNGGEDAAIVAGDKDYSDPIYGKKSV